MGGAAAPPEAPAFPGLQRLVQTPEPIQARIPTSQGLPGGPGQGGRRIAGGPQQRRLALAQVQAGPPAVVATRREGQHLAQEAPGRGPVAKPPLAVGQPEQLAGGQGRGQLVGGQGVKDGGGLGPALLQKGLTRQLPLQLPAGRIPGPTLQHPSPGALVFEGQAGLHGGAVLQGGNP